jgi:sulfoxide reductase catalytic subunit YedY
MHYFRRNGWEIPERQATSEGLFLSRRTLLAAGPAAILATAPSLDAAAQNADDLAGLYPAKRNEAFQAGRDVTPERLNLVYNNFYEFGPDKRIFTRAASLKTRPWTIKIDGLVETPFDLDVDSLLRKVQLEERIYRHRCVEGWAMTVPWTGFPLKQLVALARPLSSAKFVRFETFMDLKVAPGQKANLRPWPYVEGLSMPEAMNDLALLVTGAYGKPLAKQFGAPLRLHTPWKYGFKSIKSISRISFVEEQPRGFWQDLQPAEYGFWANVNPAVPHPRWSQASEELLGGHDRVPTIIYNGYGEHVAYLYKGAEAQKIWF